MDLGDRNMTLYEEIEELAQFALDQDEFNSLEYNLSDDPTDEGYVAYKMDDRGNGPYVRYGYTLEELNTLALLKLIKQK